MSAIILKLGIKDARKVASGLIRELPTQYVEELKIQLEDYDRKRREQEERRKRELAIRREREAKEAECKQKGHLEPTYDNEDMCGLLDGMTLEDTIVQIPSCSRCGESLVILADGSFKDWLSWTKIREPLHNSMRISPKADCREATSSPTRRSLDQFLFA